MLLKVRLLLGAAVPLVLALPAAAQVQITTATTTPVTTATANGGQPSDVVITNTGSVTITGATAPTGVTVNSNNTLTNNGSIVINNINDATGVRIGNNVTGGYTGTGQITLTEDYTRTDTDNDNDLDGPLAQGSGRAGILLESGGTLTGDIRLLAGSAVTIEGNNSQGVSLRSAITGNYFQKGNISILGSNTVGIEILENVSGNVQVGGSIAAQGENSIGLNVLGDIGGEFLIDGGISATGFTSTTITNYADPDSLGPNDTPIANRRDADDLLVGGPAVAIRGDLARGLLVQGAAVGGVDPTEDVKDVVQDFNENRTNGVIVSVGSAPALLIQSLDGAAGDDIRLSLVRESVRDTLDDDDDDNLDEIIGTFDYTFGFMNRGSISANGLNIGFAATGVKIAGSADGQHDVIIDGGIFNGGSTTSTAFEADAIGYDIGSGVSTPVFQNGGSVQAALATETDHDATAILFRSGADVPSFINNGAIVASVRGYDGDAVAVRDLSGTLTAFRNTSRITAGHVDDDAGDDITSGLGRNIAIDLSHSTSNISVIQTDPIDNARIFGDVLFGVGNDRLDLLSGEIRGDIDFGAGNDTLVIDSAGLGGDIFFRGANASVTLSNEAIINGELSLGTAAGSMSFSGNSFFDGAITRSSNAAPMTMTVNNSTVNNRADGTLALSSLDLTNNAKIGFVIDNARLTSNQPIFNVTGAANVAANTVFTPIFEQFNRDPFTVRVLTANQLNLGGPVGAMLNANSPFLYNVSLQNPAGSNALDLVLRVKTAQELGLSTRQTSAYDGVLNLLEEDDGIAAAISAITTGPEFTRAYADMLPGPDASVVQVLATNSTAAFGATARRLDLVSQKPDAPGGAWVEEFGVYHESDASADTLGVFGGGFGVAAGLDLIASRNWVLGGYIALESLELEERGRTAAPVNVAQTTFGGYGGIRFGQLALNGSASYGNANFTSDREVRIGTLADRIAGDWDAQTVSANARATWTLPLFDFLDAVPYAGIDYIGIKQDAYREEADNFDSLEFITDESESKLTTASYGLSLVGNFGGSGSFIMRPELTVGYRNVLTWDNPDAQVRFGGNSAGAGFVLNAGNAPEDAVVGGLGLNVQGQFVNMKIGYDAEISDSQITHYGSITLRLAFW